MKLLEFNEEKFIKKGKWIYFPEENLILNTDFR